MLSSPAEGAGPSENWSEDGSGVSLDLNLPNKITVDDSIYSKQWDPVAVNDSGEEVADAVLDVELKKSGEGRTPILARDDYPFNECDEE